MTPAAQARHHPLASLRTLLRLAKGRIPGQAVIQFTDRCNAACPQCGMRRDEPFVRATMDTDQTKRLLDAMAARGVQAVSFTGGEPLLYLDQVAECIRHAVSVGITYVRTGSNGFFLRHPEAPDFEKRVANIAQTLVESGCNTFWLSLDSASSEAHEQNRGLSGVVAGMAKGLPIFHAHGLYPSANLGINRLTGGKGELYLSRLADSAPDKSAREAAEASFFEAAQRAFRRFYVRAEELGFTIVNACYPMSSAPNQAEGDNVYAAASSDDIISFSPTEKRLLFQALYQTIPEFRSRLRIFTPRSSLLTLIRGLEDPRRQGYACRGGIDFFFVDARNMDVYPCGYRGQDNLGKFWDLDLRALAATPECRACEWECFRDPSELLGPFLDVLRRPFGLAGRMLADRTLTWDWLTDLRYYRACDFFNARLPLNPDKLRRFSPASPAAAPERVENPAPRFRAAATK